MSIIKKILPLLFVIFTFVSCSNDVILDDTHYFENATWKRFSPEVFTFDIDNIDDCYDIYFTFKIDPTCFRAEKMPFIMHLIENENASRLMTTEIALTNKDGNFIGKKIGSYYEYSRKVREYFFFNETGKHKFEIKNGTPYLELEGIISFGIKIVKSEMDLSIE